MEIKSYYQPIDYSFTHVRNGVEYVDDRNEYIIERGASIEVQAQMCCFLIKHLVVSGRISQREMYDLINNYFGNLLDLSLIELEIFNELTDEGEAIDATNGAMARIYETVSSNPPRGVRRLKAILGRLING